MTRKILLVDDSAYMRGVLKKILRTAGFNEFVEAPDGEVAIEMYRRENPEVVLMDLVMPNKNGLDALRAIKSLDREAHVIMVSAVGQDVIVEEALQAGAEGFIVKPFQATEVREAVERTLSGGAA